MTLGFEGNLVQDIISCSLHGKTMCVDTSGAFMPREVCTTRQQCVLTINRIWLRSLQNYVLQTDSARTPTLGHPDGSSSHGNACDPFVGNTSFAGPLSNCSFSSRTQQTLLWSRTQYTQLCLVQNTTQTFWPWTWHTQLCRAQNTTLLCVAQNTQQLCLAQNNTPSSPDYDTQSSVQPRIQHGSV